MATSRKRFTLTLLSLSIFGSILFSQGYEIKLNAPDFAGQEVILAEYFTNRMVPKDTAQISLMGEAVFSGDQPFDGGLYIVYFNSNYYFDLLMDKDQFFTISADSSDFNKKTRFEGSVDNTLFYEYKNHITENREKQNKYIEALAAAKNKMDSSSINEDMDKLNEKMLAYNDEMILKHKPSFFSTFIQSLKEEQAPESIVKGTKRQQDSIRFVYYRDHYLDNFDFSDIRLLHTPIYDTKVKTYINNIVPQNPDSLITAIDFLMEKSRSDEAIFRYMLITLFNNYAESKIMGMDKVYFYIAEKYYIPEASWSDEEFLKTLKENLEKSKPTFIGNIAPDFELKGLPKEHFLMAAMDTAIKSDPYIGYVFKLSDIPSKYTILYFWEADCGHCQKSTPQLYDVYKKYSDQGVKAVVVHVINSVEGKVKWVDFVNEKEMHDWINCWSPHNNEFRKMYNLQSFPQLFILDKDRKIVAKNLSPEQVDDILSRFLAK